MIRLLKNPLFLTTVAVALTLPANVSAGLDVEVLYDQAADFSTFETYRWVAVPLNDSPEAAMVDERIKTTADAELVKKGLRRIAEGEEADLLVTYYGGIEDNLLIEGVRFELAPHVVWTGADPLGVTHRYEVGTLVIDLAEASTEKIVWSGSVQARASTRRQLRDKVEKAVRKVLKQYPPD